MRHLLAALVAVMPFRRADVGARPPGGRRYANDRRGRTRPAGTLASGTCRAPRGRGRFTGWAGRRRTRRARGDAGPGLRSGLLGGGAHVRREYVAGLDVVLGGGPRGVPRVGEQHSGGHRGNRRDQAGAARPVQSRPVQYRPVQYRPVQSYPVQAFPGRPNPAWHEHAPSHEIGAYQPATARRVRFTVRSLP